MKVAVENVSSVKRTLSVEVGPEVVDREFASAYEDLSRRVKIPGFRPGKVPLALLEKRYSQEIEDDVVRRLVPRFYEAAIKEAGLSPVELPTIENISLKREAPLLFTATVEVRPAITLQPYQDLPVTRRPIVVEEADVTAAVDSIRERQAQLDAFPEEHAITQNDYVVIDFEGRVDGRPIPNTAAKGYLVHVGSGTILPELDTALLGRRKGERFETEASFPADHRNAQLAGRTVTFQVGVVEVKRKVLPAVDDELAKDLGVETLEALHAKLRDELSRRKQEERRLEERRALLGLLLERHRVDLPSSLVQREAALVRDRILRHIEATPRATETPELDRDALDREAARMAEERVKGDLLLEAIAERERIEVDQNEIDLEVERLARETRSPAQEVRKLVAGESGTFVGLRATLLREKTLDWLLARAKITEEAGPTHGLTS